ncbi:MAG: hypothetical protein R2831_08110 [Chitinophagaceae bacterium]
MKKIIQSLMITCQEASLLTSKSQDNKLKFSERFKLFLHIKLCPVCYAFYKQIGILHESLKNMFKYSNISMSNAEKHSLQEKINQLVSNR